MLKTMMNVALWTSIKVLRSFYWQGEKGKEGDEVEGSQMDSSHVAYLSRTAQNTVSGG